MVRKSQDKVIHDEIFGGSISEGRASQISSLLKQYEGRAILPGLAPTFFEDHNQIFKTGCISIDSLTFVGGVPRGKMIQVWGKPRAHKSTICLSLISKWQKQGLVCAWADAEFRFDPKYAVKCGVDLNSLILTLPDSGQDALNFVADCIKGAADIVVVDSAGCLMDAKSEEKDIDKDDKMAAAAHMINNLIQRNTKKLFWSKGAVVMINQIRANPNAMGMMGPQYAPPGGHKLQHAFTLSMKLDRVGVAKENGRKVGHDVKITIDKSSVGPDGFSETIRFLSDPKTNRYGMQFGDDLLQRGIEFGVLDKVGTKFTYEDRILGAGRSNAAEYLDNDQELYNEIYSKVWEKMQAEIGEVNNEDEDESTEIDDDTE